MSVPGGHFQPAGSAGGKVIIIGFVGGFVSQDDAKHPEVQFAAYLRYRYPLIEATRTRVFLLGNVLLGLLVFLALRITDDGSEDADTALASLDRPAKLVSARRFAAGLRYVTWSKAYLYGHVEREVAEAFAHFGGGTTCALEQMLSGPVDAVYIATHPRQSSYLRLSCSLTAGKHVLCEKPSMLNGQQLEEVLVAASTRGLLFMEAMKTPFFPLYRRLREHLEQDPIGQVAFVRAGSSIADIPLNHPIYNLDVGGGSLLGIGPYEAFLALDWLGPVERVQTFGQIGPTGIDTFATLQTKHLNGMAQLYCGLGLHGEGDALLVGPLGNVTIPSKWWNPIYATIRYIDGRTVELDEPFESTGFN